MFFSQSASSANIKDGRTVQCVMRTVTWIMSRHLLWLLFCHHFNEVLQH